MVHDFMRDRLRSVPADLYRERYPAIKTLDAYYGPPGGPEIRGDHFRGIPPEANVVQDNIAVGKWLKVYWHATTNMLTLADNLTQSDPQFKGAPGPAARPVDYLPKPKSPAWGRGFKPIPADKIGLYLDEFRRTLPRP
jgi:hypothetical protein